MPCTRSATSSSSLPSYNVDIGTIAGGMFLMALKFVIEHAILLQSENELTI